MQEHAAALRQALSSTAQCRSTVLQRDQQHLVGFLLTVPAGRALERHRKEQEDLTTAITSIQGEQQPQQGAAAQVQLETSLRGNATDGAASRKRRRHSDEGSSRQRQRGGGDSMAGGSTPAPVAGTPKSPQSAHAAETKRRRSSVPSSPVHERSTKQKLGTDTQPEGLHRHPDRQPEGLHRQPDITRMGKAATQLMEELAKLGYMLDQGAMRRLGLHVDKAQVRHQLLLIWHTTSMPAGQTTNLEIGPNGLRAL